MYQTLSTTGQTYSWINGSVSNLNKQYAVCNVQLYAANSNLTTDAMTIIPPNLPITTNITIPINGTLRFSILLPYPNATADFVDVISENMYSCPNPRK